jgi:ribonuclease HI
MKKQVTIYTDGACSGNPGPGGWGCILMYNQHRKESSGGALNTTNNRMEITAALEALKLLKEPCGVDLYTDSAYLCNALEKKWLDTWSKNGWKTASKSNVENQDLWKELIVELDRHDVQFHKVKGHADNEYNNRCDKLARDAVQQIVSGQKS